MSSSYNRVRWPVRLTLAAGAVLMVASLVGACGDDTPRGNCASDDRAMMLRIAAPYTLATPSRPKLPKPPASKPTTRSTGGTTTAPKTGTPPRQTPRPTTGTNGNTSRPTIKPLTPVQKNAAKQALKSKQKYRSPYNHKFYVFHDFDYFDDIPYDPYNPFDPRAWEDPDSPYYQLSEAPDTETPTYEGADPYVSLPSPTSTC